MTRRFHMDLSCESKYGLLFGDDISCTEKAVESKTVHAWEPWGKIELHMLSGPVRLMLQKRLHKLFGAPQKKSRTT